MPIAADLAQAGEPKRVVEECIQRYGQVEILFANTGGPPAGSFDAFTAKDWNAATSLVLMSIIELVACVLSPMAQNRWGRILAVTSIAARERVDNLILSNTLRPAVGGFINALAEVASFGITANSILPGYTNTERVVELHDASVRVTGKSEQTSRRVSSPVLTEGTWRGRRTRVARQVDRAGCRLQYVNGAALAVDGGWLRGT